MALMVSVSGVRGLVGETLSPSLVAEFAQAYGSVLAGGRVVLARDTRPSGEMYQAAALSGLLAAGCRVTDLGVAMTPTVGHAIRSGGYAGGVSITASHNPTPWNGIKFLDEQGLAPDAARAAGITEIREQRRFRSIRRGFAPVEYEPDAGERHSDAVRELVAVDLAPLKGMRIVLDSINGAGCLVSPGFLASLGCDVLHVNGEPHGEFAHPPEPIAENLGALCDAVRRSGATLGFAQDPDADRLAIVDEQGRYIGEEYTLALGAWSLLSQRLGPVAANLSTSRMIDSVAERFGVDVLRTPVGEANVARVMLSAGCVVGGEGNGGVIDPRVSPVRDSLTAMSLVLQLMAATGRRVSVLVAELPRFAMIKRKFECPRERIDAATARVAQAFAGERLNTADGARVDFREGWVHIRASNTEPIIRIIAEANTEAEAEALIQRIRAAAGL